MDPVPNHQLCKNCATINIRQYFQHALHSRVDKSNFVGPTKDALKLGTFESLHKRSSECCLCRLVVKAICNRRIGRKRKIESIIAESQKAQTPIECWLYSYCFADSNRGDVKSAKAYRIGIATQMKEEGACACEEHAGDIQLLATDARNLGLSELFHGRSVDTAKLDMELPQSWISHCEREHKELCEKTEAKTLQTAPQDLVLIDVKRLCLCYPPQIPRYVALSYCWPTSDVFRLRQSILSEMLEIGSIERRMTELPLRIRHAIQVAADLGETYLWVDALCIVQDVKEIKKFQILQMNKIYGSAFLTIVSAPSVRTGDDTETCDGFPRYSENPEGLKQIVETVQNLHLAVSFDTVSEVLNTSRWNTRAWTYEESLLSKRRLYFTGCQVYFQCSCSVFCEDGIGEGNSPSLYIFEGSNLYNMGGLDTSEADEVYFGSLHLQRSPYLDPKEAYNDYSSHLVNYTLRHMSDPSDIFNAFYGIQNVLEYSMNTKFLYGLTRKYLDTALLWTLMGPHKRRVSSSFTDRRSNRVSIPSWTWAGWDSQVEPGAYFSVTGLRSEVCWFLIERNHYTLLETEAVEKGHYEFPHHDNKVTRSEGQPPNEFLSMTNSKPGSEFEPGSELERLNQASPQCLACWTATAFFVLTRNEVPLYGYGGNNWPDGVNLAIQNEKSRWVGAIMMNESWITENLSNSPEFEFMLLSRSEAHAASDTPQLKFFDEDVFEKRPWCLINVMMIQREKRGAERLGVGFIHEDAWIAANPKSELITLI